MTSFWISLRFILPVLFLYFSAQPVYSNHTVNLSQLPTALQKEQQRHQMAAVTPGQAEAATGVQPRGAALPSQTRPPHHTARPLTRTLRR